MKYVLMSDEIAEVERLSKAIENLKRSCNVQTKKICPYESDFETGVCGLMAEYAVCKTLGVDINKDLYSDHGDFGVDFTVKGKTVDVKFNRRQNGYLYFNSLDHFRADIGVLCVPGDLQSQVWMVGVIGKKRFLREHEEKDWGYGKRYAVSQDKLKPFEEFLEWTKQ